MTSLTEDYEIGLRLRRLGLRAAFVSMPERPGGLPVAVRAFFPASFGAAVRQKARWVTGIALAGWDRLRWEGRFAENWMRFRDRRAVLAAMVLAASYAALLLGLLCWSLGARPDWPPATGILLRLNLAMLCWRAGMRAFTVSHFYGPAQGAAVRPAHRDRQCRRDRRRRPGNLALSPRHGPAVGQDGAPFSGAAVVRLKGRQLRFILASLVTWIAARFAMLLGGATGPTIGIGVIAGAALVGLSLRWPQPAPPPVFSPARAGPSARAVAPKIPSAMPAVQARSIPDWVPADRAPQMLRFAVGRAYPGSPMASLRHATLRRRATPCGGGAVPRRHGRSRPPGGASRWSASAYLFVRQGSGRGGLAANGQLGGSQTAARITYRLNSGERVRTALTARLYAPLDGKGAEAAVGLDWYPLPAVPLRLSAERRVALDHDGRDAWSVYAAGGFYAEPARGLAVDGYGQAGTGGVQAARPVSSTERFGPAPGSAP